MASPIQNEQSEKPGSAPAAPPRGDTSYIQAHGFNLGLITVVAWVANYLHITSFGLYEDDWFFLGFPFLVSFKDWMFGSMLEQFKRPYFQGRPLQNVFASVFAEAGALTHSLVVDYLIAYVLFAGSAVLMYEVLRRRFSTFLSTVAVLLFVLTPLHTLHQYLDLQFSFGPGFMLVFLAILLYQRGQQAWSYVLAVLSAFCYESIFFLFLGAPLLCSGPVFRGRRRAWLTHLGIFAALVACYFAGRRMLGETRVADLPGAWALVSVVAQSCVFHTFASFLTYLYAALRAHEATVEAWFYAALFLAAVLELFLRRSPRMVGRETATDRPLRDVLAHAGIGFAFIVCGYIVSYFVFKEPQPHFRFTDRDTRISAAASFGSSIFCAALLTAGVRLVRSRISRVLVFGACSVFLLVMFLYSFVLQQDYVEDWQEQRTEAAQVMTLTPDVERDSIIILELHVPGLPFFTSGSRRRAIGLEKTLYEYQFSNLYALGQPWPRLFVVYSDEWPHHLKLDPDGLMRWTEPVFNGRWYPASGDYRYRPGRFIVLEEQDPGWIVRHSDPILVDGQQIVQVMPADFRRVPLWASLRVTALSQAFLPGYAWKSALPETVPLGTDATLATDVVTFTWPRVSRAVDYWIDVGTAPAQGNIFGGFTKGKTEMTVSLAGHLTGETIYVQLYAKYPGIEFAAGTGAKYRFPTVNHLE